MPPPRRTSPSAAPAKTLPHLLAIPTSGVPRLPRETHVRHARTQHAPTPIRQPLERAVKSSPVLQRQIHRRTMPVHAEASMLGHCSRQAARSLTCLRYTASPLHVWVVSPQSVRFQAHGRLFAPQRGGGGGGGASLPCGIAFLAGGGGKAPPSTAAVVGASCAEGSKPIWVWGASRRALWPMPHKHTKHAALHKRFSVRSRSFARKCPRSIPVRRLRRPW